MVYEQTRCHTVTQHEYINTTCSWPAVARHTLPSSFPLFHSVWLMTLFVWCLYFPGWPLHVFPVCPVFRAAGLHHAEHHEGVWLVHLLHSHHILPWLPRLCQQGKQTRSDRLSPDDVCHFLLPIYTRNCKCVILLTIPLGKTLEAEIDRHYLQRWMCSFDTNQQDTYTYLWMQWL